MVTPRWRRLVRVAVAAAAALALAPAGARPVAQVENGVSRTVAYDPGLGTPILQTSAAQGVTWRAEYEPYGAVYSLRSPDQHQPLRLPGQEAEQLGVGANGVTSRSYNLHRWYDSQTSRYTSVDPMGTKKPYAYADDDPLSRFDPLGLLVEVRCERIGSDLSHPRMASPASLYHHCFVHTKCPCSKPHPFDKTVETEGADEGLRPLLDIKDYDGSRGEDFGIIVQPPGSVDCSFERCILDAARDLMATHPGYHRYGPNSNTFAHQLIKRCGMQALVPYGDPPVGWDHPWSALPPWHP